MGAQTSADGSGAAAVAGAPAVGGGGGSWAQPAPLAFDIREIERFRYRVEDTLKKVRGSMSCHVMEVMSFHGCHVMELGVGVVVIDVVLNLRFVVVIVRHGRGSCVVVGRGREDRSPGP